MKLWNTGGILIGLALLVLSGAVSHAQGTDPRCDGQSKVAKGLCTAASRTGCFDDPNSTQCDAVAAAWTAMGLGTQPWLNPCPCWDVAELATVELTNEKCDDSLDLASASFSCTNLEVTADCTGGGVLPRGTYAVVSSARGDFECSIRFLDASDPSGTGFGGRRVTDLSEEEALACAVEVREHGTVGGWSCFQLGSCADVTGTAVGLPPGVPADGECVNVVSVNLYDGSFEITPCNFEGQGPGSGICAGHACNQVVLPGDCASVPEGTLCSPGPTNSYDFCVGGVCGGDTQYGGGPNWCQGGGSPQLTCDRLAPECYLDTLCDPLVLGCPSAHMVGCPTCDNPVPGANLGCADQNQCQQP